MTNQEKKKWLRRYLDLNGAINQKILELDAVRSLCEKVTPSYSGMPQAPGSSTKDNSYLRLVTMSQKIDREIDQYVDMRKEIQTAINTVGDIRLRTILALRYINGMKFDEIAVKMNYDYTWIWRLHGYALSKIKIPQQQKKAGPP